MPHGRSRAPWDSFEIKQDVRNNILYGREANAQTIDLAPYGVTPALLATLGNAITAFADTLGEPRHAIAERRVHTRRIEQRIPQLDMLLKDRLDLLVEVLRGTPFHTEYRTARTIVDR